LDGFINVNKGQGLTSFAVLKKLQKILPKTKMGHLGTLDPMAEGVLPVALGKATRLIEYIPDGAKLYRATMTLGAVSDTQDAWGTFVESGNTTYQEEDLHNILKDFRGIIEQIPPMYSAVHHQGTRLYELARQGIEVERQARSVEILSLELLGAGQNHEGQPTLDLEVECSKGTYIRTLCHDIGQRLGTGAYMSQLTRTQAGQFSIQESFTLEEIAEKIDAGQNIIKAIDYPIMNLAPITLLMQEEITKVYNGNQVKVETEITEGLVRVYNADGLLLAIAKIIASPDYKYMQPLKVLK